METLKAVLSAIFISALFLGPLVGGAIGNPGRKLTEQKCQSCASADNEIWQKAGTVVQGVLGALTFGVLVIQSRIFAGQRKLMERQHVATHRPRIEIKGLHVIPYHETAREGQQTSAIAVLLFVVNSGSSPCKIIKGTCTAYCKTFLNEPARYLPIETGGYMAGMVLNVGDSIKKIVLISDIAQEVIPPEAFRENEHPIKNGRWHLLVQGAFVYADESGVFRRMGFLRRYEPYTESFKTETDNRDAEYSD